MLPLKELIILYLQYCKHQKNLSEKTIKAYRIDLDQLVQFIKMAEGELTKANIINYITNLHKTYKPKTVKRKIACIRAFCNHLEYDEIIENNPFSKIKVKFQEPSLLPRIIPLPAIQSILRTAYLQLQSEQLSVYKYRSVLRDIAVLELLFATGIRVSELCSMEIHNISLTEGTVRILGKGSRERIVQIENEDVLSALKGYKDAFSAEICKENYFFINRLGNRLSEQSVRFMVKKYAERSHITMHITPHMFRHSFATLLLEEDVDIRYIQHILGHSSILTTQIYTHVASSKQKDILASKHPRNKIVI